MAGLLEWSGMTVRCRPASQWFERLRPRGSWIILLAVLALIATIRIRLLQTPLERDEGEYAYAGQLILQGIPPYQLAYNMKFPGTYAAYAVIMALFGQTPAGIHFGVLCLTTVTALMLFWLGRKLLDPTAGVVAATAYGVLAASPNLLGLAGHATHFVALFATARLCLVWSARQTRRSSHAAAAGLALGMALMMKQHAAFFCIWGLAFITAAAFQDRQTPFSKRLRGTVGFCLGLMAPFAVTGVVLWRAGLFERFWFWTIGYARAYVAQVPFAEASRW